MSDKFDESILTVAIHSYSDKVEKAKKLINGAFKMIRCRMILLCVGHYYSLLRSSAEGHDIDDRPISLKLF